MYVIHRDSSSSESRLCFWQYFLSLYLPPSLTFPLASLRRSYILYSVYYPFTVAYFVCYFSFSPVFRKALPILYFCLLFLLVLFKLLLCNYSYFIFYPASACCFPPLWSFYLMFYFSVVQFSCIPLVCLDRSLFDIWFFFASL